MDSKENIEVLSTLSTETTFVKEFGESVSNTTTLTMVDSG